MEITWLLLIYTLPAQPSRMRAFIWRELKKVGAPYLRDGVCVLPDRPDTYELARGIVARVEEFGGDATLARAAHLDTARAGALVEQFRSARASEYREITAEADRLLEHVARESEHRELSHAEIDELASDLRKLRRWTDQVVARDYFGDGPPADLCAALERCDRGLGGVMEAEAKAATRGQSVQ